MLVRLFGWTVLAFAWLGSAAAEAQVRGDGAAEPVSLTFGGDVTAIVSPVDHRAYFNYTDYDANALRGARVRLAAEWRIATGFAAVAELRTNGLNNAGMAAAYIRWQPRPNSPLVVEVGRVPPVVGAYPRRAYARDNFMLGQPLAYQYVTSLRPDALPNTVSDLIRMRGRGWQPSYPVGAQTLESGIPLVSGSTWDTGVEVAWSRSRVVIAGAVTQGSPAVPLVRDTNSGLTVSARASVRLPLGILAGVSGARGEWIEDAVLSRLPAAPRDTAQSALVLDAEVGDGPWLVRGELVRTTFALPLASAPGGHLSLVGQSGYVEGRYRLRPRWYVGTRLDRLAFSHVPAGSAGDEVPWEAPVTRVESLVAFRVTRQFDARVGWQHNWRTEGRVRSLGYPALGATFWF
jgi:hypothetical protein